MKRIAVLLAIMALALASVACGGGSDDGGSGGGGDSTPKPGSGTGATTLTVTITDAGITVDNANLSEGPVVFKVVNNGTIKRSVFFVPITDIASVPVDSDDQVDVLNPPSAGGVKIGGKLDNVPPGGSRDTNIVVFVGKAVVFSNEPGDFSGGKFRAEITISPE